jgi:hypothetical protein
MNKVKISLVEKMNNGMIMEEMEVKGENIVVEYVQEMLFKETLIILITEMEMFVSNARKTKLVIILKTFVQNALKKINQPKTLARENLILVNAVKTVEFPVSFTKLKLLTLEKE